MRKVLLLIPMIMFCTYSSGQDSGETEIEEIIVIGELSRRAVREQIIRVENDIYSFYNEHNGNPELNIECREVALTGTRIPKRVCEPVFWTRARNREIQQLLQEWAGVAELEDMSTETVPEMAEMNKVYADLIQTYPAFGEALLILEDLKARLEELDN